MSSVGTIFALIVLPIPPFVAVAVFLDLLWRNRHRLRTVLRPTRGHLVATAVMTFLTPLGTGLIFQLPAFWFVVLGFQPEFSLAAICLWIAMLFGMWYFPASLAVSSIRQKPRRLLTLFAFWAGHTCVLFLAQVLSGQSEYVLPGIYYPGVYG